MWIIYSSSFSLSHFFKMSDADFFSALDQANEGAPTFSPVAPIALDLADSTSQAGSDMPPPYTALAPSSYAAPPPYISSSSYTAPPSYFSATGNFDSASSDFISFDAPTTNSAGINFAPVTTTTTTRVVTQSGVVFNAQPGGYEQGIPLYFVHA
jgi:hypothetical protein